MTRFFSNFYTPPYEISTYAKMHPKWILVCFPLQNMILNKDFNKNYQKRQSLTEFHTILLKGREAIKREKQKELGYQSANLKLLKLK